MIVSLVIIITLLMCWKHEEIRRDPIYQFVLIINVVVLLISAINHAFGRSS